MEALSPRKGVLPGFIGIRIDIRESNAKQKGNMNSKPSLDIVLQGLMLGNQLPKPLQGSYKKVVIGS